MGGLQQQGPANFGRVGADDVFSFGQSTGSEEADESFAKKLQRARKDTYTRQRPKAARYRPDSKDKPAAGKPKILNATKKHRKLLQEHLNTAA